MNDITNNSVPRDANAPGFLLFEQIAEQVPFSKRKLRQLIQDQVLPVIRLPHTRRLLFDQRAVEAALRRHASPPA